MRKIVTALGVLAFTAIAGATWYAVTRAPLFVANGLPVPVQVFLDGEGPFEVPAEGYVSLGEIKKGLHSVQVRRQAVEVEQVTISLTTASVLNVLGSAPVATDLITYSSSDSPGGGPNTSYACGKTLITESVDYRFVDPPRSIELPKGSRSATRTAMRLASGGYRLCMNVLGPAEGAEFAIRLGKVLPNQEELEQRAIVGLIQSGQLERALQTAKARAEADKTVESHRTLQMIRVRMGQRKQMNDEYSARFNEDQSADNLYLLARNLEPHEAVQLVRRWLDTWPNDPRLRRTLAWNADAQALWAESLAQCEWAKEHASLLGPGDDDFWAELHARALVALGRSQEAVAVLESDLSEENPDDDRLFALARAALMAGKTLSPTAWDRFAKPRTPGPFLRYFFEVMTTGKSSTSTPTPLPPDFLTVQFLAQGRPALALAQYRPRKGESGTPATLEAHFLLLGEAWQSENAAPAAALERDLAMYPLEELKAFVLTGEGEAALNDLSGQLRACLWLARTRRLVSANNQAAAKKAFAHVSASDPLEGLAVQASRTWEDPKPLTVSRLPSFELRLLPEISLISK